MKQKELMNNHNKALNLESQPTDKEVFDKIAEVIRENFIAIFTKEGDTSLLMRLVGGLEFRLTVEAI